MECSMLQKAILKGLITANSFDETMRKRGLGLTGIDISLTAIPGVSAVFSFLEDMKGKRGSDESRYSSWIDRKPQPRLVERVAKLDL